MRRPFQPAIGVVVRRGRLRIAPRQGAETGDLQGRREQWTSLDSLRAESTASSDQFGQLNSRPVVATPYVPPRTPLEKSIADVRQDTLGVDGVGVIDNFFTDLRGSSLLATQVTARLREQLHVDLPLRRLFDGPTIAELAESIDAIFDDGDRSGGKTSLDIKASTP